MTDVLKSNKGFSIIEGLVVISVIAVLAGAFGISMSRWLPEYRLNSAVRDLNSVLQQARLGAVKGNADVFVQFDTTKNTCLAYLDIDDTGVLDTAADKLIAQIKMPTGVVFTKTFGLTINSRGFPNISDEIHITNNQNNQNSHKGLDVSLGGNIRIIRSFDDGATWH